MTTWSFDRVTINRVVDGDTVVCDVDVGFGIHYLGPFRLLGCNARELPEPGGKEARANLASLLPAGTAVTLQSVKNEKYGRYLAIIYLAGVNITTTLINTGWAAAWDGVGTAPIPAWPR